MLTRLGGCLLRSGVWQLPDEVRFRPTRFLGKSIGYISDHCRFLLMTASFCVLVADDQPAVREALRILLTNAGYRVELATSPREVLRLIKEQEFALALLDLNYARDTTSGEEGLELIQQLQKIEGAPPALVMTAWATVDLAVAAMRSGARDFIQKPWDNARVLSIIQTQLQVEAETHRANRLEAENQLLRKEVAGSFGSDLLGASEGLIARSPAMRAVLEMVRRVAPAKANVLITGENGTGKGVVARALHGASDRADKPFITINMGGLSESLFESELFGHVKGAFTDAKSDRPGRFELADGGTLFLDEIGNVPVAQQAKLLRTLETGEFERLGSSRPRRADVRLISATNADLVADVEAGRFRRDLYFRLNTVEISLPALRDRVEDIPVLARHFLRFHAERYRKNLSNFSSEADQLLLRYPWPGNVRELDHTVERAVLMADSDQIEAPDLGLVPAGSTTGSGTAGLEQLTMEEIEKLLIKKALDRYSGNVRRAAEALGLSRSTFYRRLQEFGL
jgi:DNA-binding NtrC family response regulator